MKGVVELRKEEEGELVVGMGVVGVGDVGGMQEGMGLGEVVRVREVRGWEWSQSKTISNRDMRGTEAVTLELGMHMQCSVEVVRRVWGTLRMATYSALRNAIVKLAEMCDSLKLPANLRPLVSSGKPKWWLLLHAEENILLLLERNWEKISLQKGWCVEPCTRRAEAPGTIEVYTPIQPPTA